MSAVTAESAVTQGSVETPGGNIEQSVPVEPPKPSREALDFLKFLVEDDYKNLLFPDNLVTTSDTGKELGEFSVTVETTKHRGQDCFLLHANSHGSIDTVPCGTSIVAYVNKKLVTLEQQHQEYVKLENHPLDRKTIVVRQEEGYVINRVITQGEDVQRTSKTLSLEDMEGFISEGSNLLLQRLLVKKGVEPHFQMLSFDSDTHLCPVVYKALDGRTQVVNGTELDVTGIERTINSQTDLPTTWQAYFTRHGHLTSRVQVGSPVTMRLAQVPTPIEEDDEIVKPKFGKQPLNWEEDVQLYSQFLDRKEELKADHAVYMRHHPELRALLADFLQFLLLRKPDDVIAFAAEYFSTFSTQMPNTAPYQQSSTPAQFPESKTNSKITYLSQTH